MPPSSATAYQALQGFQAPSAQDVLSQANDQFGVGADQTRVSDLRGAVANLNTSLNAVDPSVTGRTSGTFTTEAQRSALVNKEQAPIQTNLTARGADLTNANSDLSTATGNSTNLASAIMSQNQNQYQKLLDQYNAASDAEKQQEATREFNASLAEKTAADKASSATINPASYLGGGGGTAGLPQGMSLKNPSSGAQGYNFNFGGNPVSAATFAKLNNQPIENVLYTMAQSGDKTAASAYQEMIANHGSTSPAIRAKYSSLFWGT